jgi:excinuclease UvrABC nuclease subunit
MVEDDSPQPAVPLQQVRDETHRFATAQNTKLRAKDAVGLEAELGMRVRE